MTSPTPEPDPVERTLVPESRYHLDHADEPVLEPHVDPVFTGSPVCAIHGGPMTTDGERGLFLCAKCDADWESTMKLAGG